MTSSEITAPTLRLGRSRPRRSVLRRLAIDLSWVLMLSGGLLLADAAATLLWQEPLTALVSLMRHGEIDQRLLTSDAEPPLGSLERAALAGLNTTPLRIAYLARREQRQASAGAAIGRITIPKIGVSYLVVQGTDSSSLEKGPGHYPSTALPGLGQTVAIAGHRTTYLAPFRHIDALRPGNRIVVKMPYGRFLYQVQYTRIVTPYAWWVTDNVGYERLVLSACNPLYSAAQRIVVFARLVSVVPEGAARRLSPASITSNGVQT